MPPERHDQVTKFTAVRPCSICSAYVLHHQVASFDRVTGFKTYSWLASNHRCTTGRNAHERKR